MKTANPFFFLQRMLHHWLIMALMLGTSGIYYYYTIIGPNLQSHAYQLLGEGFLAGHLHLSIDPDPQLAELENPYDPITNRGHRIQDFSYYDGKYYLYFGPVPALLWIGINLITGLEVYDGTLMLIFASLGTAALSLLIYLMAMKMRIMHRLGLVLVVASVAFGTWIPFMLREPYFYEAAIAGAYCFSALGALCIWQFFETKKRFWLGLASLSFGFSAACRITHVFNTALLGMVFLHLLCRRAEHPPLRVLAWLAVPWLICMTAIGAYNAARFGSPFDIGSRYVMSILGDMHDPEFRFITPEHAVENAYFYLMHPLSWNAMYEFPFFEPSARQLPWIHTKRRAWYVEPLYGLVPNSPFILFFLLMLCDWSVWRKWAPEARTIAGGLLLYSGATFAFLLVYFFFSARYQVDFAPWVMALGGVYFLHLLAASDTPQKRQALLVAGFLLAAYSVFAGIMAGYCSYSRCG